MLSLGIEPLFWSVSLSCIFPLAMPPKNLFSFYIFYSIQPMCYSHPQLFWDFSFLYLPTYQYHSLMYPLFLSQLHCGYFESVVRIVKLLVFFPWETFYNQKDSFGSSLIYSEIIVKVWQLCHWLYHCCKTKF